jgi:hypothetical protein
VGQGGAIMRKHSKKLLIFVISIGLVIFTGVVGYSIYWFSTITIFPHPRFDNSILRKNIEAYNQVVQIIYDDFQKCECLSHAYSLTNDEKVYIKYANNCERFWKIILINNKEFKNYKIVRDTFRIAKKGIEDIRTFESYVVFYTVQGQAHLVYSVGGEKPTIIDDLYGGKRANVRRVRGNWYYTHIW